MAQANEQKNISFEDVWGKSASANIISGKVATPLCLAFLGVCHNEKDSAHSLNRIMQALARCQLNEELLLLLEIICDIADMDYPQELIAAINDPLGADDLVRELILDFDEILTEEIASAPISRKTTGWAKLPLFCKRSLAATAKASISARSVSQRGTSRRASALPRAEQPFTQEKALL